MTDRTNAPYDPAAAETSHEWATRVGQEHDTWHQISSGSTGGSLSGNWTWHPVEPAFGEIDRVQGLPWTSSLPADAAVNTLSLNGQSIGRYSFSGAYIALEDGSFAAGLVYVYLRPVNLDGVDNSLLFASLNAEVATMEWAT